MKKNEIQIFDFIIIGGGYTGLSIATELIDKGFKVKVIEKSKFIGGLGETIYLSNGYKCESFYHHFFTHDKDLINYSIRFIKNIPIFNETKMSIFYKGKYYPWNGIIDLFIYPHINIIGKLRFIIATLLLSYGLLPSKILDRYSLNYGLKKLYGKNSFKTVWDPMLQGKFGDKTETIPLRWMHGRLKQRLLSRDRGKEKLGYIKGSLDLLTSEIKDFILQNNSSISCNTKIEDIRFLPNKNRYLIELKDLESNKKIQSFSKKIIFTTSSEVANYLIKNLNTKERWKEHKYFTAYCVLIEMKEALSEYYWTNIADKDIFFCGYIEQTQLTDKNEYGGLHIAYLTKYVYLDDIKQCPTKKDIKEKAIFALKRLFPEKLIDEIVINLYVSIAFNAQVITDFNFRKSNMELLKSRNIFIGNMSNIYPEERSINNAIKVGKKLGEIIDL